MPAPSTDARRLGERFQLAPRFRARRGLPGERLGRGVGSSLEFADRRAYEVGDDVRHLDWRAFARTDQLLVKQYEEEIRPRLELFLDLSRSMAVEEDKLALAVDLAGVLLEAARRSSYHPTLFALDDAPRPVEVAAFFERGVEATGTAPLPTALDAVADRARAGSLRVVISDFLVPVPPGAYFPRLVRPAGQAAFLQVLGREDVEPPHDAAERLVDSETAESLERVIDDGARARYLERLARWNADLEGEARRLGGAWTSVTPAASLAEQVRTGLVASGLLEV